MTADLSVFTVTSFPVRLPKKLFMCAENTGPEDLSLFLFFNKGTKKAPMLNLSQQIVVKNLNFYNNIVKCYENYYFSECLFH